MTTPFHQRAPCHRKLGGHDAHGRQPRSTGTALIPRGAGHGVRSHAVRRSRAHALALLIGMACLGAVIWFSCSRLPAVVLAPLGLALSIVPAVLLYRLISHKPVLTLDETGILYPRGGPSRIAWRDILSVERLARVQRLPNGEYHSYIREAWRPIRLQIRGARSEDGEITIAFMGLDTDSAEVFDWIREYLRNSDGQNQNLG